MNSRERIIASINHKEPDKVPVDLGSNPSSGISAIAYSNLLKYLKMDHLPVRGYDVVQQLTQPHDQIIDLFGVDVLACIVHEKTENKPNYQYKNTM